MVFLSPSFKYGTLQKINFNKPEQNDNILCKRKRHPPSKQREISLKKKLNIKINKAPVLILVGMNSNAEGMPDHDVWEVSKLELG